MNWLTNVYHRFAPMKSPESSGGKTAPKSTSAQEFDELFESWNSLTGVKLTGTRIQSILKDADAGNCSDQAALIEVIQEAEPIIGGHLDTRKRAALAVPWRIEGGSQKDRDDLTRMFERIKIQKLRRHLLDAIAQGYACAGLIWKPGGGEITGWTEVHPTNILFDGGSNAGLLTRSGEKALAVWHPNQFLMHIHKAKPGLPCRGALLRTLIWSYFFKFYGVRDYARFIERFGMPFIVAKLSDDDFSNDEKTARIINAIRALGSSGVAAVTKATDLENQAVAAGGKAEFFNWFKYLDDVFALVILGQIASSKEANGMSNGDLQSDVKDDLTASDSEMMEESFNTGLVQPLDRFRNGRETGLHIIFASEPAEDLQDKADLVTKLAGAGYKAKRDWVEKVFEIPLQEEKEPEVDKDKSQTLKTREKSPKSPDPSDDPDKALNALSDADVANPGPNMANALIAKEELIAQLTENTLRELFVNSDTMTEFYFPLTAAIRSSFKEVDPNDPELVEKFVAATDGFFEKYPSLYEEFDSSGLEKAVSGAMLAANVNGYTNAKNLTKGSK